MNTKDSKIFVLAGLLFSFFLMVLGVFAWWAFSWSTHTLVWAIFIFGSLLGSTSRVKKLK